jgi:hypothetical protein
MTRHLSKCNRPEVQPETARQEPANALHLLAEGGWGKVYWLHRAVPLAAPLNKLDDFLRKIWLECCGHLSAFEMEGVRYAFSPTEGERSMRVPLSRVVDVGSSFLHEYDYGSTTTLRLKVLGFWSRAANRRVELLARNDPPRINCETCGTQPATQICTGCDGFWLCEACSEDHDCGLDYLLPNVNSPRVGVCGYCG